MTRPRRSLADRAGWLLLALAIAYVGCHVAAYALGMTPAQFFSALAYFGGFAFGVLVVMGALFQLIRR